MDLSEFEKSPASTVVTTSTAAQPAIRVERRLRLSFAEKVKANASMEIDVSELLVPGMKGNIPSIRILEKALETVIDVELEDEDEKENEDEDEEENEEEDEAKMIEICDRFVTVRALVLTCQSLYFEADCCGTGLLLVYVEQVYLSYNRFYGELSIDLEKILGLANTVQYLNLSHNKIDVDFFSENLIKLLRNLEPSFVNQIFASRAQFLVHGSTLRKITFRKEKKLSSTWKVSIPRKVNFNVGHSNTRDVLLVKEVSTLEQKHFTQNPDGEDYDHRFKSRPDSRPKLSVFK
ncbi:hypothetical protein IFM89_008777 [Coptis chinensis]|uniref:Uncharacterized protein n=1 Tax=Coptis chinensis TaxID=261450 RepID=A0A835GY98_9MAGN|nr:hypothetical protein IFM89_008777 [Coptis chinensis]